ncbi:MAG: hypothetical protein Hyperionvirus1_49 [Hyperionvirus sp.]|uniref:Uncharacterized protein n=1 Tax=Hyperionvirus sp. TaxID=2487770 RepID=A0A3G5A5E3_9VIRU|nr:MAG: hypothetical protein Hyperionvirus1_49 [Hyperionvirus sp.]
MTFYWYLSVVILAIYVFALLVIEKSPDFELNQDEVSKFHLKNESFPANLEIDFVGSEFSWFARDTTFIFRNSTSYSCLVEYDCRTSIIPYDSMLERADGIDFFAITLIVKSVGILIEDNMIEDEISKLVHESEILRYYIDVRYPYVNPSFAPSTKVIELVNLHPYRSIFYLDFKKGAPGVTFGFIRRKNLKSEYLKGS